MLWSVCAAECVCCGVWYILSSRATVMLVFRLPYIDRIYRPTTISNFFVDLGETGADSWEEEVGSCLDGQLACLICH